MIYILLILIAVFVFVKFFLPKIIQQRKIIKKPDTLIDDQGIEIAILSWFHDHPLCKIPASDIITLHTLIKPFLKQTNDTPKMPSETERITKRSIRDVHKEKSQRPRRIIVRAWEDDRDNEILDDNTDRIEEDSV